MSRSPYTEKVLRRAADHRLRNKTDTTVADVSWYTLQIDPNNIRMTAAGTASDGDYVMSITPVGGAAIPVSANRGAGETSAEMADELVVAIAAAIAEPDSDWYPYVVSSSAASGVLDIIVKPGAPPFVFSTTPPGTATMAFAPIDTFPITKGYSPDRPENLGFAMEVEVFCVQVDSSGVPLANGTTTVDMTLLRAVERKLSTDSIQTERPVAVTHASTSTGLVMGLPVRLPFNGGRVGVHLSALTNPHASVEALEVWVRECVA